MNSSNTDPKSKYSFNKPSNIICLDFETTGLNTKELNVIEVAFKTLYRDDPGYSSFIKIDENLPERIIKLTNITDDMLQKYGKDEIIVIGEIYSYISTIHLLIGRNNPLYFIAHNGNTFDFIILKNLFNKYDLNIDKQWMFIDTLSLSRKLTGNYGNNSMEKLCEKYNLVNPAPHRALGDVLTLIDIYILLSNDICNKNHYNIYTDKPGVINKIIKSDTFPQYLIEYLKS